MQIEQTGQPNADERIILFPPTQCREASMTISATWLHSAPDLRGARASNPRGSSSARPKPLKEPAELRAPANATDAPPTLIYTKGSRKNKYSSNLGPLS